MIKETLDILVESFKKNDAFGARNISNWLGYLHQYGVMSDKAAGEFKAFLQGDGILKLECNQQF